MKVTVFTALNKIVENMQCCAVLLPAANGQMQILDDHIPVLSCLNSGQVILDQINGESLTIEIDNGYVRFADNVMVIVVEKTQLTLEELKELERKAEIMKDAVVGGADEITEEEFEHMHQSEAH
jgi:F0F1-type ATP synthase epsilon subunit